MWRSCLQHFYGPGEIAYVHRFDTVVNDLIGTLQSITGSFQECQTLPIVVLPLPGNSSAIGVPPYSLIAFEDGGVPTSTIIGSDPKNLTWQVKFNQGALAKPIMDRRRWTHLIFLRQDPISCLQSLTPRVIVEEFPSHYILSRVSNSLRPLFLVADGASGNSDTSCLRASPPVTSLASIEPNVTTSLATCQPWGLTVSGGQKPYTLVIVETHAATITEVTLGPEDDTLTYVNRADPNWQIMGKLTSKWLRAEFNV